MAQDQRHAPRKREERRDLGKEGSAKRMSLVVGGILWLNVHTTCSRHRCEEFLRVGKGGDPGIPETPGLLSVQTQPQFHGTSVCVHVWTNSPPVAHVEH